VNISGQCSFLVIFENVHECTNQVMKRILIVVGTRPNFIKVTRFLEVAKRDYKHLEIKIAHTGQHFDENMAGIFFKQFNLSPDYFLSIDSKTPVSQMGEIMINLEKLITSEFKPDLIITPGDVNSTLAVSITANKLGVKLAHLESGLRSFDRSMPEEINRIITDEISDLYFVTEPSGVENLKRENQNGLIHFVGNTMIDTLVAFSNQIDSSAVRANLNLAGPYILATFHRPANVDRLEGIQKLIEVFESVASHFQVVFPVHPRTRKNLSDLGLLERIEKATNVVVTEPLGYFEFQNLVKNSQLVLTDSGGIQEETTYYKIPCLTVRDSTERPVTIEVGSNELIQFNKELIVNRIREIKSGKFKASAVPELWDGKSTERILQLCWEYLSKN
jgi:UDP-N-acetylglucosamine 2-epimerase (non-hydrolysing)